MPDGRYRRISVKVNRPGARVIARSHHLTTSCMSDAEIETHIQMLKDDLDTCANEMKRLLKLNRSGALFEGWPSANDDML